MQTENIKIIVSPPSIQHISPNGLTVKPDSPLLLPPMGNNLSVTCSSESGPNDQEPETENKDINTKHQKRKAEFQQRLTSHLALGGHSGSRAQR